MPAGDLDEARAMARAAAAVIETVANELAERPVGETDVDDRISNRKTQLNVDELTREIARLRAI